MSEGEGGGEGEDWIWRVSMRIGGAKCEGEDEDER